MTKIESESFDTQSKLPKEQKRPKIKTRSKVIATLSAVSLALGVQGEPKINVALEGGYTYLSSSEYTTVVEQYSESPIAFRLDSTDKPQVLAQITVSLDKPEPVFVRFYTHQDELPQGYSSDLATVQSKATVEERGLAFTQFSVRVEGQELVVPWVDAEDFPQPQFQVDGLKKGDHTVTIFQPKDMPQQKDSLALFITTPRTDSLIGKIVDGAPSLAIRPDDLKDPKDNSPLLTCIELSKKKETTRATYFTLFTAEKGGMSPASVWKKWKRTTDIEWTKTEEYVKSKNAGFIPDPFLEYYQGADHTTNHFTGKVQGSQALLQIFTLNNNFSDKVTTGLDYSPIPDIPLVGVTCDSYFRQFRSITQEISRKELLALHRITPQQFKKFTFGSIKR